MLKRQIRHQVTLAMMGVLLLALLSSCVPVAPPSPAGQEAADVSAPATEPVVLQFWSRLPDSAQTEALVQEWNETHPDIQVEYQGFPNLDFRTKLLAAVAGGNTPDVIGLGVGIAPQHMNQGNLLPLDDFIDESGETFRNDFGEGLWFSATHEDITYGIPWWVDPSALYYNKKLFAEAGLDGPPKTWEDLLEAAAATTQFNENGTADVYGAVFPVIGPSVMFIWLPYLWANGGDLLDENDCAAFNTEAGVEAMQLWVDLFQEGYMPRSAVLGQSTDELVQLLLSNKAAMYVSGPSLVNFAAENAPEVELGTALMPRPVDGQYSSYLGGDTLSIMKNTDHPEEAWTFIQWMVDSNRMRDYALAHDGVWIAGLPSRDSAYTEDFFEQFPSHRAFAESMEVGRTPNTEWITEARVPVWNNFQEALLGNMTVEEALADAEVKVNEITGCIQ